MRAKDVLGQRGEALAAEYLEGAGLKIVGRNWRSAAGELDIVAIDGTTLVAVEVKTRSSLDFGHPLEAISDAKLARLYLLAGEWARAHGMRGAGTRVDAVGIVDDGVHPPVIEHLKAVG